MAVHGTRNRESVSWNYAGVLGVLRNVARDRTGLPLLRCYWYEATVEGRRASDHEILADLPGVKLRLGKMKPGRREGVESEIHRDLTTLARNRAISDALVVSAEEDLAQVIADVQDLGLRVILVHIAVPGAWTVRRRAPPGMRRRRRDKRGPSAAGGGARRRGGAGQRGRPAPRRRLREPRARQRARPDGRAGRTGRRCRSARTPPRQRSTPAR